MIQWTVYQGPNRCRVQLANRKNTPLLCQRLSTFLWTWRHGGEDVSASVVRFLVSAIVSFCSTTTTTKKLFATSSLAVEITSGSFGKLNKMLGVMDAIPF